MIDVEKLRRAAAEKRASGELVSTTNPAQRMRNAVDCSAKITRKMAIDAMCWQCCGGYADKWDVDTRKTIRECAATPESDVPCPLWIYRPYK